APPSSCFRRIDSARCSRSSWETRDSPRAPRARKFGSGLPTKIAWKKKGTWGLSGYILPHAAEYQEFSNYLSVPGPARGCCQARASARAGRRARRLARRQGGRPAKAGAGRGQVRGTITDLGFHRGSWLRPFKDRITSPKGYFRTPAAPASLAHKVTVA